MKHYLTAYFNLMTVLFKNYYAVFIYIKLNINKITIGKLFSGKANLSYGLSFTKQMPMRYPTGFV